MSRPFNFSAGPATLPEEVLQQAAAEMLDWHGSGMSVMEMSHRGKEFVSIYEEAESDIRELLAVPQEFSILFMQGGGDVSLEHHHRFCVPGLSGAGGCLTSSAAWRSLVRASPVYRWRMAWPAIRTSLCSRPTPTSVGTPTPLTSRWRARPMASTPAFWSSTSAPTRS